MEKLLNSRKLQTVLKVVAFAVALILGGMGFWRLGATLFPQRQKAATPEQMREIFERSEARDRENWIKMQAEAKKRRAKRP